jgi:hypothetical protein
MMGRICSFLNVNVDCLGATESSGHLIKMLCAMLNESAMNGVERLR